MSDDTQRGRRTNAVGAGSRGPRRDAERPVADVRGQLRRPLGPELLSAVFGAAALLLAPRPKLGLAGLGVPLFDAAGVALFFGAVLAANRRRPEPPRPRAEIS